MENIVLGDNYFKVTTDKIEALLDKMNSGIITEAEYQDLQHTLIQHYIIQDILYSSRITEFIDKFYSCHYPICHSNIDSEKILFISDTHFGSEKENLRLVLEAYNFALRSGINTIVHAGDLVEGTALRYETINSLDISTKYDFLNAEIVKALEALPSEIKTKLLIGNHDYSSLRTLPPLLLNYFGHDNLDILGMGRAIINWCNLMPFEINHPISHLYFDEENAQMFKIIGHSHRYCFNDRLLYLPSLSDDLKGIYPGIVDSKIYLPGFVVGEIVDNKKILFSLYCKWPNEPIKLERELTYDILSKDTEFVRRRHI